MFPEDLELFDVERGIRFDENLLAETLLQERPGIGVLFMSGYPQGLSEEGFTPTTEGVLSKPFTERGLLDAVRESIASTKAGERN